MLSESHCRLLFCVNSLSRVVPTQSTGNVLDLDLLRDSLRSSNELQQDDCFAKIAGMWRFNAELCEYLSCSKDRSRLRGAMTIRCVQGSER